jgi:succinate dehydrogenase/fumarate reductase flavoprotein subunit
MTATLSCDLLLIGSGAGGLSAAVTAAFHGLKVIVAEKEPVFGTGRPRHARRSRSR